MLQLVPPIWLLSPKGRCLAVALIDVGPDWDLLWVTFDQLTGECWTYPNKEIRADKNITLGMNMEHK